MKDSEKEIDVAAAIKELKWEVLERGESFEDIDISSYEVNPDFPIACHRPVLGRLNVFIKSLVRKSLRWYIVPIVEQMNEALRAIAEMRIVRRVARLERLSRSLSGQLAELTSKGVPEEARESPAPSGAPEPEVLDQYLFQDKTRGDEKSVRERQKVYVPYFEGRHGVLDIGCGRGEFLELLREAGIGAKGVELNEDMVLLCREKGLSVEKEAGLSYLTRVPDDALGGVFMAQVVEHLAPQDLGRLLRQCYRKLEPRAPLIVETVNPTTKLGMDWFHRDISHTRPLHPATLELILQSVGFSKTDVRYVNPVPEERKLQKFPLVGRLSAREMVLGEAFNRNVDILNRELFGYQDYVVIAFK